MNLELDSSPAAPDPGALQYQEIAFSLVMSVVAVLGRGNPLVRYPGILWAFAAMLAFNMAYHRMLRGRGGAAVPLVSMAVNVALCSLVLAFSGGEQSSFWPLYLLPIFTACLHLRRRHVLGAWAAAGAFLACFYLEAFWDGRRWEACEFLLKLGVLGFAAAVTAQLSFRERAQRADLAAGRERIETLDRSLGQAQKMEAVGRLAGGIAHDFNNILTAIKGYCSLIKGAVETDGAVYRDVVELESAADRAAELTHQLLAFSRKQVLKPEVLDLNGVISGLESMMRCLIRDDIKLVTRLRPGLGSILADPGQISQVILNLIVNGRDAMPGGGRLVIETGAVEAGDGPLGVPGVSITVADEGVGMAAEVLARIFEPFFTTKEPGKGTGLGLATVYGIVSQSEGRIEVDSVPGRGTKFVVHFPRLAREAAPRAAAGERGGAGLTGCETVCIVEDESAVRDMLCRTLRERGYEVLSADGGEEAARVFEAHPGPIDVLVTDMIMPGMNGRALAQRLSTLKPGVRILYMSGYTDDVIARHGVLEPGIAFLQKPFAPAMLAQKIRDVLSTAA